MTDILKAIEWLEHLKTNERVLIKGNIYPFYYLHIDKNTGKKKVGKCLESGQVIWQPVSFEIEEIKSKDWVLQIED
jgi:hypothetical protein